MPEILKVTPKNFKEIVKITVKAIEQGKVTVCPTDTLYGLIADARNQKAVKKLLKIKKRQSQKPIPIFVKDIKMAKKFAQIKKEQEKILKKVWPGKVTVILKPKRKFPKGIGKPKREIGLRIPDYKIVNKLLSITNLPLTGTSANISDHPPSTKIKEVLKQFKNQRHQPDLVVDAGDLSKSKPSKILDLTTFPPKILRK